MPRPGKTRQARVGPVPCDPVLDLNSHIATKVAVFANRLQRSASRFYRKRYGIGVVEWRLVMFIGQAAVTRANRICSETELDKGAVSRSLSLLQRMGVVSIEEDGADSRRNNVALTAKGRALHDEMVPAALDRQSELVADLTQAEIEIFVSLIDRMQATLRDGDPMPDEPLSWRPASLPPTRKRAPQRGRSAARGAPGRRR